MMNFFEDINTYIEFLTTYIFLSGVILMVLFISVCKIIHNQNLIYSEIKKALETAHVEKGDIDE